jgi:hypothetical protein
VREARGPKFEAVKSSENVLIVDSKWLEDCLKLRRRVEERLHRVDDASPSSEQNEETRNFIAVRPGPTNERHESSGIESEASLVASLAEMLRHEISCPSILFSAGHFYLAGFTENDRSLRNQLGKLLRRGLGTIYWDFHDGISHVIVKDGSDKSLG